MSENVSSPEEVAPEPSEDDRRLEASIRARQQLWKRYGKLESGAFTFLKNPLLMGTLKWPSLRTAFVRVDRTKSVLMASDGLSDPFTGEPERGNGHGLEVYMETRDQDQIDKAWADHKTSWLFQTLYNVAQNIIHIPDVVAELESTGLVSMELQKVSIADEWKNDNENIGVLLGVTPKTLATEVKLPLSKAKLVAVVLLRPEELEYAKQEGEAGLKKLNKLLRKKGEYHLSSLNRKSVI